MRMPPGFPESGARETSTRSEQRVQLERPLQSFSPFLTARDRRQSHPECPVVAVALECLVEGRTRLDEVAGARVAVCDDDPRFRRPRNELLRAARARSGGGWVSGCHPRLCRDDVAVSGQRRDDERGRNRRGGDARDPYSTID